MEFFGFCASLVVAISLTMSSVIKLRVLNLIGALMFSTYGFLIKSMPVAFLNLFIVFINIYYLLKIYKTKEDFKIIEIKKEEEYFKSFIKYYEMDIRKFFPEFTCLEEESLKGFYVIRNLNPAGIVLGKDIGDIFCIHLDYTTPKYRDFKVGKYLFGENSPLFKERAFKYIETNSQTKAHSKYLVKMGFQKKKNIDGKEIYSKILN